MKSIFIYLAFAGVLLTISWLYVGKSQEVAVLSVELQSTRSILAEAEAATRRAEQATVARDRAYELREQQLVTMERSLNGLVESNKEIRDMLLMSVPPDALRLLKSYQNGAGKAVGP